MTYHRLYELIRKYFESQQIHDQTSDMLFDEYLIRVAQLIEAHNGNIDPLSVCDSLKTHGTISNHGFKAQATHA